LQDTRFHWLVAEVNGRKTESIESPAQLQADQLVFINKYNPLLGR